MVVVTCAAAALAGRPLAICHMSPPHCVVLDHEAVTWRWDTVIRIPSQPVGPTASPLLLFALPLRGSYLPVMYIKIIDTNIELRAWTSTLVIPRPDPTGVPHRYRTGAGTGWKPASVSCKG